MCNREAVRALNLAAPKPSDRQVNDQARNAKWGAGYDRNKGWSDKNWERKQVCCCLVLGLGCLWAWFGLCHLQESKWHSKGSAVIGWDPRWAAGKGGRATKSPEKPNEYYTPLPLSNIQRHPSASYVVSCRRIIKIDCCDNNVVTLPDMK